MEPQTPYRTKTHPFTCLKDHREAKRREAQHGVGAVQSAGGYKETDKWLQRNRLEDGAENKGQSGLCPAKNTA